MCLLRGAFFLGGGVKSARALFSRRSPPPLLLDATAAATSLPSARRRLYLCDLRAVCCAASPSRGARGTANPASTRARPRKQRRRRRHPGVCSAARHTVLQRARLARAHDGPSASVDDGLVAFSFGRAGRLSSRLPLARGPRAIDPASHSSTPVGPLASCPAQALWKSFNVTQ